MNLSLYKVSFLACTIFLLMIGCGQNRAKVFDSYLKEISEDKTVAELRNNLRDSLQLWIDTGLDFVQFLRKTEWKIDESVFFDKDRDKALFLVPFRPIDSSWPQDYVKIIAGEKVNNIWKFYYASYPLNEFERSDNENLPFSFEVLVKRARYELVEDGFIECNPLCRVNYGYIDSDLWFADWMRKMHIKFLQNKMPTISVEDPKGVPH